MGRGGLFFPPHDNLSEPLSVIGRNKGLNCTRVPSQRESEA